MRELLDNFKKYFEIRCKNISVLNGMVVCVEYKRKSLKRSVRREDNNASGK